MERSISGSRFHFAGGFPFLGVLFLALLLPRATEAGLERPGSLNDCAMIEDDSQRLKCYDELAGRKSGEGPPKKEPVLKTQEEKFSKASYFSQLWELEPETRRGKYAITPYRSNYILPYSYNDSPNVEAVREADPNKELKNAEIKFQLSLKVKLWEDILKKDLDLWFGYTQQSFWQFYNFEDSSPFRETNYEPEILINYRTDYRLLGFRGRFFNVGFNHQSNGQSEPLSRSWNRIVGSIGFERKKLSLLLKGWYRIPEFAKDDDNPHMEDYLGYGELWAYYFWKESRFAAMVRNNLQFPENRGALQLEWSFPIFKWVGGYLQYYVGYGESLMDYNHRVNRIGIGFILNDWN